MIAMHHTHTHTHTHTPWGGCVCVCDGGGGVCGKLVTPWHALKKGSDWF